MGLAFGKPHIMKKFINKKWLLNFMIKVYSQEVKKT